MTESVPNRRSTASTALERTVEALEIHFARDHISLAEFERRLDDAYAAREVLGGLERRGRWTAPPKLVVVPLAGSVILDFREAEITTDEVEVVIASVFGDVQILVPPKLRVEVSGVPIIGVFEHRCEGSDTRPDAPILRVKGVALMGKIEVKVMKPGEAHRPDW